jgi:hypothetical protein
LFKVCTDSISGQALVVVVVIVLLLLPAATADGRSNLKAEVRPALLTPAAAAAPESRMPVGLQSASFCLVAFVHGSGSLRQRSQSHSQSPRHYGGAVLLQAWFGVGLTPSCFLFFCFSFLVFLLFLLLLNLSLSITKRRDDKNKKSVERKRQEV